MVELGNMRDSGDAARMTSSTGQATYAAALAAAARSVPAPLVGHGPSPTGNWLCPASPP